MPFDSSTNPLIRKKQIKSNLFKLLNQSPPENKHSDSSSDEELNLSRFPFKSVSTGVVLFRGLNARQGEAPLKAESFLGKPILSGAAAHLGFSPERALKVVKAHVATFSEKKLERYCQGYVNHYRKRLFEETDLSQDLSGSEDPTTKAPSLKRTQGPLAVSTTYSAREALTYGVGRIQFVKEAIESSISASYNAQGYPEHRKVGILLISFVPKEKIPSLNGMYVRSLWAQRKVRILYKYLAGQRHENIIPGGLPGEFVSGAIKIVFPDFTKKYGIRLYRLKDVTALKDENFLNTVHGHALVLIDGNAYFVSNKKILNLKPVDVGVQEELLLELGLGKIEVRHENYDLVSTIIENALEKSGKKEAYAREYKEKYGLTQKKFENIRAQFAEIHKSPADYLKANEVTCEEAGLTEEQYACRFVEEKIRLMVVEHYDEKINKLVDKNQERIYPSIEGTGFQKSLALFKDATSLRQTIDWSERFSSFSSISTTFAEAFSLYSRSKYSEAIRFYKNLLHPSQLEKLSETLSKVDSSKKAPISLLVNRIPNAYLQYAKSIYHLYIEDKMLVNSLEDLDGVLDHVLSIIKILEDKKAWVQQFEMEERYKKERRTAITDLEERELLHALLVLVNNSISLIFEKTEQGTILEDQEKETFADTLRNLSKVALFVTKQSDSYVKSHDSDQNVLAIEAILREVKPLLESLADALFDSVEDKEEREDYVESIVLLYDSAYQFIKTLDSGDELFRLRNKKTAIRELEASIDSLRENRGAKLLSRP